MYVFYDFTEMVKWLISFDMPFLQKFLNQSNNGFLSLDQSKLPFNISDFNRSDSPTNSEAQPIQVIGGANSHAKSKDPNTDFNIDDFFKSLLHEPTASINPYSASAASMSGGPKPVPPVTNSNAPPYTSSFHYTEIPGMGNYDQPQQSAHSHHHSHYSQSPNASFYQPPPMPPVPSNSAASSSSYQHHQHHQHHHHNSGQPVTPANNAPYAHTAYHDDATHSQSYHQQQPPSAYRGATQQQQQHTPLAPPPVPPSFSDADGTHSGDEYNPESWDQDMSWQSGSRDTSFNLNSSAASSGALETPVSPPPYDRTASHTNAPRGTREFGAGDDWRQGGVADGPALGSGDVDHRQLRIPGPATVSAISKDKMRALDVDHRNLISLTGSPTGVAGVAGASWMQEVRFL